ncbi:protein-PII uridylyltransferase [Brachybacterium endophyticum]|uniref:Bifunctional uridylyltransferase/uridylyl-removing enzyme n=1 Tax=Brachybacterium endophyticum TaxID=2182385 RepID=A0A2U2RLG6_9MICO|nr:HD domain-containing protein [Brachybacterium endophyticum]PWH06712.1 protein-PII uridylyltransferase [Brachybacterium endophyticum]
MPSEPLPGRRLTHVLHAGFADPQAGPSRRHEHAVLVDGWLGELWEAAGAPASGAALAAIGSLGRRDLGPMSDLDLILLVDPEPMGEEEAGALAARLWYPIWDSGTSLDHAVRSPEECAKVAQEDLRAAISLLDLRPVAGDVALVDEAAARVRAQWRRDARRFTEELIGIAEDREGRYGQLAHSTEPNLKSDRGGLRDTVVIRAFAESWLADHDHRVLDEASEVLLDARDALQTVTGRGTTRLTRADQDSVAGLTGFDTADDHLAALADASRAVAWQLHRTVRAARAAAAPGGRGTRGLGADRRPVLTRHPHGVIVQGGEVSIDPRASDPLRDLAAVRLAATSGMPLADATLSRLASGPTRSSLSALQRDVLVDALAGEHIGPTYEALDVHGAFGRWVAGWDGVRNRPQRSPVHRFTVDRHQIETVREAQAMLGTVDRPDILLVAALLHDLGKRAGSRDHAAEGAPLARAAALRLGFDASDADLVELLVREHLTLVELATGRDPSDASTLEALLQAVGRDLGTLELLRALTEADARAAGPAAWSSWRSQLVDHVTAQARDALTGTPRAPRDLLAPQRAVQEAVREAVVRTGGAQVLYPAPTDQEPITQVCLGAPDGPGVFAAQARVLARHRMDVRSAVVLTLDGVAVNTWWVTGRPSEQPHPTALRSALEREIRRREDPAARVLDVAPGAPPRTAEDAPVVTLLPGASSEATVVQVNARNRPSLLADVAEMITLHRLHVRSAHVMTLGQRAVDVLYLTDTRGRPLDAPMVGRVIAALMDAAAT